MGVSMPRHALPWSLKKQAGYWYVRFRGESTYHSTGIRIENERASRQRAEAYARKLAGVSQDAREYRTFAEYAASYFCSEDCPWWKRQIGRGKNVLEITRKQHRSRLEIHILPRFGLLRFDELTPSAIENWLYNLDYSSQWKRHIYNTFSIIIKDMRRDQVIPFDSGSIEPPIPRSVEKPVLTDEEAAAVFPEEISEFRTLWGRRFPLGVMCALLYSSGLRTSEARALEWSAIDVDACGLKVAQTVNRDGKIDAPKAGSFRAVIIPRWTMDLLAKLAQPHIGYVFKGRNPNDFLYLDSLNHALRAILLKINPELEGITPHSLRHGYNTRMRQILSAAGMEKTFHDQGLSGFRVSTVAADELLRSLTGHRTERMTSHYDHPVFAKIFETHNKYLRPYVERYWDFRRSVVSDSN